MAVVNLGVMVIELRLFDGKLELRFCHGGNGLKVSGDVIRPDKARRVFEHRFPSLPCAIAFTLGIASKTEMNLSPYFHSCALFSTVALGKLAIMRTIPVC